MLAQRAERGELEMAVQVWTPVYLLAVGRADEVLIEAGELTECGVAQEALIGRPIPRELCGQRRCHPR